MGATANNLLKLKEWVTVSDAAKYLSDELNVEVQESDVLEFGRNRHLQMSVFFKTPVPVKLGEIFPLEGAADRDFNSELATIVLTNIDHPDVFLHDPTLQVQIVAGVWDLLTFDGQLLDTNHQLPLDKDSCLYAYPDSAGGAELTLPIEFGVFIQSEGQVALLREELEPIHWRESGLLVIRSDELQGFAQSQKIPPIHSNHPVQLDSNLQNPQKTTHARLENPCDIFLAMKSLMADEVSFAFIGDKTDSGIGANNFLEVSARGEKKCVALAGINLVNRSKTGGLNHQGIVLLGIAHKKKLAATDSNRMKISRLREVLKTHFGIISDPFHRYNKGTGWEPRFKIDDKRGTADIRARIAAEKRTSSYERMLELGEKVSNPEIYQADDEENDPGSAWLKINDPDMTA